MESFDKFAPAAAHGKTVDGDVVYVIRAGGGHVGDMWVAGAERVTGGWVAGGWRAGGYTQAGGYATFQLLR